MLFGNFLDRKLKQARLVENTTVFPNPRNRQAMEQFLFSELTLGEELLHNGLFLFKTAEIFLWLKRFFT